MNTIKIKERAKYFGLLKDKKKKKKFFPLSLNHSRDDILKAQVVR